MESGRSSYKCMGSDSTRPVRKCPRVCVVGAGPAGLCAAKHSREHGLAVTVFEQSGDVGGTWRYTECVDRGEHGAPVHTSMYRDLRINLPKDIMIYPGFPHKDTDESYITSREVLEYLKSYADAFSLRELCKFNNHVKKISKTDYYWLVTVVELPSSIEVNYTFDIIFICDGVNNRPYIPELEGSAMFQGLSIHSQEYRNPEPFSGQTVLVIGEGSSALALTDTISQWADKVLISHHSEIIINIENLKLPDNVVIKPDVKRLLPLDVEFTDGTTENVDTVIYCTGFRCDYSFLDGSCGITADEDFVFPLYKHFINANHPSMCIMGNIRPKMQLLPTFDIQVRFFLKSVTTNGLPEKEIMLHDISEYTKKKEKTSNGTQEAGLFRATPDEVTEYYQQLASIANIEPLANALGKILP